MIQSLNFAGRAISPFQLGIGVGALTVFLALLLLGFMTLVVARSLTYLPSTTRSMERDE